MVDVITFADLLSKADLSRQELADASGCSVIAVGAWCTGTAYPTIDRLPQLAEMLDVSIDVLVRALIATRRMGPV